MESPKKWISQGASCVSKKLSLNTETPVIYFPHLKTKHPLVYKTIEVHRKTRSDGDGTASQPLIVDAIERIKKLDSSSKEHKELTKSVVMCLAKDMLPIYVT